MARVTNARALGASARERRRQTGLTQSDVAQLAGVSREWLVRFEAGAPRAELSKVFHVLSALRLGVELEPLPPRSDDDPFAGLV